MTPKLLLRTAAAIALLLAAAHALGGLSQWSPWGGNAVLDTMRTVRFLVTGVRRSYLDLLMGFGWSLTVSLALQAVLLWQLATIVERDPALARPMIGAFVVAGLATTAIAGLLLFPVAALFSGVLVLPLAVAWIKAGPKAGPAIPADGTATPAD